MFQPNQTKPQLKFISHSKERKREKKLHHFYYYYPFSSASYVHTVYISFTIQLIHFLGPFCFTILLAKLEYQTFLNCPIFYMVNATQSALDKRDLDSVHMLSIDMYDVGFLHQCDAVLIKRYKSLCGIWNVLLK